MLVNMKLYVPRGILFSMPNHRACSMTQKSGSFTLLMTAIRDKCRGWRKHWARLYQDIIPNLNQVLNHLPSGFPGHSMNPRTQHPRIMLIKDSLCARCQSLCFAYWYKLPALSVSHFPHIWNGNNNFTELSWGLNKQMYAKHKDWHLAHNESLISIILGCWVLGFMECPKHSKPKHSAFRLVYHNTCWHNL